MMPHPFLPALVSAGPDTLMHVKVVPGASRSRVMGMLGDRVKIAVAVPPQGGKANQAVCGLIAQELDIAPKNVEVLAGHTQPRKTVRIVGRTVAQVAACWTS